MQTHNLKFVTFESSPGFYCCDVYRDDIRMVTGQAYSSPDTALLHRLANYIEQLKSDEFEFRVGRTEKFRYSELSNDAKHMAFYWSKDEFNVTVENASEELDRQNVRFDKYGGIM